MLRDITVVSSYGLVITEEHKRQMEGNKSRGWIYMTPGNFLDLTTGPSDKKAIMEDCKELDFYNKESTSGRSILPPWLDVECEEAPLGKILGHEGRHRAAACIKAKVTQMPVFLIARFGGVSKWRTWVDSTDPSKKGQYRFMDATDFPKYVIGEFLPLRHRLPLETWKSID